MTKTQKVERTHLMLAALLLDQVPAQAVAALVQLGYTVSPGASRGILLRSELGTGAILQLQIAKTFSVEIDEKKNEDIAEKILRIVMDEVTRTLNENRVLFHMLSLHSGDGRNCWQTSNINYEMLHQNSEESSDADSAGEEKKEAE